LHRELAAALANVDHEVVIVDDSADSVTRGALAAVAVADGRWQIIERPLWQQTGLSTAVIEGIQAARGKVVCVMDGDLQHPPELIPKLLAAVETEADLAVASRYVPGGSGAGLAGTGRRLVSRGATGLARALFPETRRTTDPLSGFFCCRRRALLGLEFRPLGFKVLLEVLVCNPSLRVVDIPLAIRERYSGESKASAHQGLLYLKHLWSLFVYVPGSAVKLKFALVTITSLLVFFPLLMLLHRRVHWVLAWIVAASTSTAVSAGLHHVLTFRDLIRRADPDRAHVYYPIATAAAVASFATFALVTAPHRHPWLLLAALSQCVGVMVSLVLNRPQVRKRIRRMLSVLPPNDLQTLGRRLGAQRSWCMQIGESDWTPERRTLVRAISAETIASVATCGRPLLWVESPSPRPQPRVNLQITSGLLVPCPDSDGKTVAICVFVRHAPEPFGMRHLEEAIVWLDRVGSKWLALPAVSSQTEVHQPQLAN